MITPSLMFSVMLLALTSAYFHGRQHSPVA